MHDRKQVEHETGRSLTFGALLSTAELTARRLISNGCTQRDVIAVYAPNSVEWIVFLLAILRTGAVPSLVNHQLKLGGHTEYVIS
jgi:acyl-coenzyme A synthetase/AMP-(fatty) acid ligase